MFKLEICNVLAKQVSEISAHVRKISIIFDYEMIDIFLTIMIDKP